MRVGAWQLCLGQGLSWSLCLASAVSSLLTFLTNRGSSGAGEAAVCRPSSLRPPLAISPDPWELWPTSFFSPDPLGQEQARPEVTLFTWQVQDSISGDGLRRGPFPLPSLMKTVIRCHFPWRPSLSSGAAGIITRLGPLLPCTAPGTDATCCPFYT